jgi:hypothetical protein
LNLTVPTNFGAGHVARGGRCARRRRSRRHAERRRPRRRAAKLATDVDWTKDSRWVGIAGKLTNKGAFSVGGAKEYGHLIHKALTDPSTEGYSKIRS